MKPLTVLITDGDERSALATVRSLGLAGYRCVVAGNKRGSLAGGSRYAGRSRAVPSALNHPREFAAALRRIVREENVDVVLPIAEPSLLAILEDRNTVSPAIVPFPDLPVFKALCDKAKVLSEAAAIGIHVPHQTIVHDIREAASLDTNAISYPVVIKPSRSVGEAGGVRTKLGVSYASNATELLRRLRALPAAAFPLLLQQRIVGPGVGVFFLIWDGEVRAEFAHRRLSEKPVTGGVSVYRESVPMDEGLRALSLELLRRFDWNGVAMVEYKRDQATGIPYLMEINGRLWGSLQLAIDAGVNFPRLLVDAATGRATARTNYRVGVRSRWWWGQVDHLIGRLKSGRDPHGDGGPSPTATAVAELLLGPFRESDYEEVMRWSDPRPFYHETVRWLARR